MKVITFLITDRSGKVYHYEYVPDLKKGTLYENGVHSFIYGPGFCRDLTMDEALKLGGGKLYKVSEKRLHQMQAEVQDAIEKISDDYHGGDSVANQEIRNGKEEGKGKDKPSSPKKRASKPDNLGRKDAQDYEKAQEALNKNLALLVSYKRRKKQELIKKHREAVKKQLDGNPDAKIKLIHKHKSPATCVGGGGDIEIDRRTEAACAEILAQLWGLRGLPTIEEEKINPLKYEILRATHRNPLPAVYDPWRKNDGPKILITNDESGSCVTFSGATKKIAQELANFAKEINVSVYYAPNSNGSIIEKDVDEESRQREIYSQFDYILYIGDYDGISHLEDNKLSGKSTWIYLDNYAYKYSTPRARWRTVGDGKILYVDRVDVRDVDGILEGLKAALKLIKK